MQNISSKEAQNNFGYLMSKVVKEPVVISKYGKPAAVLLSHEDFEKFQRLEDFYWLMKAKKGANSGFLSKKDSDNFLNEILEG